MTRRDRDKWRKAIIIIAAILLVGGFGAVIGVRRYYQVNLQALNASTGTVTVTIPTGSTLRQTATLLKDQKIIKSSWAFERYVQSNDAGDKIKAGTYELSSSYDVSQIVSIITEGKIATNLVTILPGQRLDQIKKTFVTVGFTQAEVDDAFKPERYANHPALVDKPIEANLEGYLYPESFQLTADTTVQQIVESSLDEMQERLTPETRANITRQGLTVYEGIILGSMIEQEASRPNDRLQIAQVFLSRRAQDMKYESDPTAKYGAIAAGQAPSLSYDSKYNTYLYKGFPPGPISNVSESSLKAVTSPADTDWLYFVAGDDGNTYFSRTLQEHEALTERHCKKLCN